MDKFRIFSTISVVVLLTAVFRAQGASAPNLVLIGGNLSEDTASVYEALIAQAGGRPDATFLIFGTNSEKPEESITSEQKPFASYGVQTLRGTVDISSMARIERTITRLSENQGLTTTEQILDYLEEHDDLPIELDLIKKIKQSTGIYFGGGYQTRAKDMFFRADGSETYVLSFMKRLIYRGMLFAGTSAGAAMQSEVMITEGNEPRDSLVRGPREVQVEKGFAFLDGVIVDQHFGQRGRFARLLLALYRSHLNFGVGIDENTALLVRDGLWEVKGEGNVYLFKLNGSGSIHGATLTLLSDGDVYDPKTGKVHFAEKDPIKVASGQNHRAETHSENLFEAVALRRALFQLAWSEKDAVSLWEKPQKKKKGIGMRLQLMERARIFVSETFNEPQLSGEGIQVLFSQNVVDNFPPRMSCRNFFF